jgi:GPH family glycoside/pentoside/hexuronide:cation symporter
VSDARGLSLHFAATHIGKCILWGAEDLLSLYVMIVLLRIAPTTAGQLFLAFSLVNAAMDLWWGTTLTRRSIKPAMPVAIGIVLACGGLGGLAFVPVGSIATTAAALAAFRIGFSLLDVPHNALAAPLAASHGHLVVARWRTIGTAATALTLGLAAMPLLARGAAGGDVLRIVLPGLALVSFALLLPLPRLVDRMLDDPAPARSAPPAALPTLAARTPVFCLIQMTGFAAIAVTGRIVLHLHADIRAVATIAPLLMGGARLAAIWLWSPVAVRVRTTDALLLAYLACAGTIALLPLALAAGTTASLGALALFGLAFGGVLLFAWARLSELACAGDARGAARDYGLYTALSKVGTGISGFVAGDWLAGMPGAIVAVDDLWPLIALLAAVCAVIGLLGARGPEARQLATAGGQHRL